MLPEPAESGEKKSVLSTEVERDDRLEQKFRTNRMTEGSCYVNELFSPSCIAFHADFIACNGIFPLGTLRAIRSGLFPVLPPTVFCQLDIHIV